MDRECAVTALRACLALLDRQDIRVVGVEEWYELEPRCRDRHHPAPQDAGAMTCVPCGVVVVFPWGGSRATVETIVRTARKAAELVPVNRGTLVP